MISEDSSYFLPDERLDLNIAWDPYEEQLSGSTCKF